MNDNLLIKYPHGHITCVININETKLDFKVEITITKRGRYTNSKTNKFTVRDYENHKIVFFYRQTTLTGWDFKIKKHKVPVIMTLKLTVTKFIIKLLEYDTTWYKTIRDTICVQGVTEIND